MLKFSTIAFFFALATSAQAQQGYEFEVYTPSIGSTHETELELQSNYVADGLKQSDEGLYPTHHATRSSLELSRTLNNWLRASAYVTANSRPGHALSYVGNRFKLTSVAPSKWNLPFEFGVANEIAYSRPGFGEYRWAYEFTPMLAKDFGPLELVFNPALELGLSGSAEHHVDMEPRGKIGYEFGDDAEVALEYYGGLGGIGEHYTVSEQRHQLFARVAGEISPRFEIGFGLGRGLTRSSDRWVLTTGLEYKLGR